MSNGTENGTVMVKDIYNGSNASNPNQFTAVNNPHLFFQATDGTHGRELWKSDGTEAGTVMVKDLRNGSETVIQTGWSSGDSHFSADDGIRGGSSG